MVCSLSPATLYSHAVSLIALLTTPEYSFARGINYGFSVPTQYSLLR